MIPTLALAVDLAAPAERAGPDLTRYVLVCLFLLVLIGALAWGLRALVAGSVRARANARSMQVLDVLPLGGKQRLCVVRCYDRTFALGVGDKEVGLIAEIDAAISLAPKPGAAQRAARTEVFADLLGRLRGRSRTPAEASL